MLLCFAGGKAKAGSRGGSRADSWTGARLRLKASTPGDLRRFGGKTLNFRRLRALAGKARHEFVRHDFAAALSLARYDCDRRPRFCRPRRLTPVVNRAGLHAPTGFP